MEFKTRDGGDGFLIVNLSGKLDDSTAEQFERQFLEWIKLGHLKFIIDCTHLEYVSSIGLRGILDVHWKLQDYGGELRVCELHGLVREVIRISGFAKLFLISENVEEAKRAIPTAP